MQWVMAVIGIPIGVVLGRYTLQEPIPFLISVSYRLSYSFLSVSFSRSAVSLRGRFTFLASAGRESCANRQMQEFSQNRAVHRNLKPVILCLSHSRLYLHRIICTGSFQQ